MAEEEANAVVSDMSGAAVAIDGGWLTS